MPKSREALDRFFVKNTEDLPGITHAWFRLPTLASVQQATLSNEEILELAQIGREFDPNPTLQIENLGNEAQQFISQLVEKLTTYHYQGMYREALIETNQRLRRATSIFSEYDLKGVRMVTFYNRGILHHRIVDLSPYAHLQPGDPRVAMAHLSEAADFMRGDLEYGYSRQDYRVAEAFGAAGFIAVFGKIMEKAVGSHTVIAVGGPSQLFDTTAELKDRRLTALQRSIIGRITRAN